jgi:hypothetical protein
MERKAPLMKYEKPHIIDLGRPVIAIHGGQEKVPCNCLENKGSINLMTPPTYEADE